MKHTLSLLLKGPSWPATAALFLVGTTLAIGHVGCHKSSNAKSDKSCSGAQGLTAGELTGASMPLKTLALTFDDGPGARTIELSRYLKGEGIRAVFFVWGQGIQNDGASTYTLQSLVDDGHLIANHTEHHYSLTSNEPTPLTEAQVVAELSDLDTQIAPFVKNNIWLFRPPYGQWDDKTAAILEKTPMKKYVGPILWNVGGSMGANQASDVECWKRETLKTVQACGDLYVKEIDSVGKGIVLLHDPYFIDMDAPESGGTYQMVQYIVPILKSKGYSFMRVDDVPEVKALLEGGPGPDAGANPGPTPTGDNTTAPGGESTTDNGNGACP